ncbi:MAG: hypothetical protein ABW221_14710 [Vicinamibacteria bacterium]
MRTHDLIDAEGRLFAFEISNGEDGLGRRAACAVVEGIPGVRVLKRPGLASGDTFCEFELDGVLFEIHEDWNDSDCFWIGPSVAAHAEPIEVVRAAFLRRRVAWRSPGPYVRPALLAAVLSGSCVLLRGTGRLATGVGLGLLALAGALAAYDSLAGRRAAGRDTFEGGETR